MGVRRCHGPGDRLCRTRRSFVGLGGDLTHLHRDGRRGRMTLPSLKDRSRPGRRGGFHRTRRAAGRSLGGRRFRCLRGPRGIDRTRRQLLWRVALDRERLPLRGRQLLGGPQPQTETPRLPQVQAWSTLLRLRESGRGGWLHQGRLHDRLGRCRLELDTRRLGQGRCRRGDPFGNRHRPGQAQDHRRGRLVRGRRRLGVRPGLGGRRWLGHGGGLLLLHRPLRNRRSPPGSQQQEVQEARGRLLPRGHGPSDEKPGRRLP